MEGAATTVYATGGKGNTRLIAWEGEKTLTFTVEDALLSPLGFAILSGAGLLTGEYGPEATHKIHVHRTTNALVDADGSIDLSDALGQKEELCDEAPIFAMVMQDGDFTGVMIDDLTADTAQKKITGATEYAGSSVFVDYYVIKDSKTVDELQIDAANFGGYYYVEASTLFRRQSDGIDMPAELTFPNVKIQSNFTFTMASTGDPSTFTFTMDAFPGYTYFNPTRKVLCAMQIVSDVESVETTAFDTVFPHETGEKGESEEKSHMPETWGDSVPKMVGPSSVAVPSQEASLGSSNANKKVADMIDDDVVTNWKGTTGEVVGTIKYNDDFKDLYGAEEAAGHFYPAQIKSEYYGTPLVAVGATKGDKEFTPSAEDPYLIVRLENLEDNNLTVKLKSPTRAIAAQGEDDTIFKLDFDKATLPSVKLVGQEEDTAYSKKGKDLMESDVHIEWDGTTGNVLGTFKEVSNWTELPGKVKTGHYAAFKFDNQWKNKPFSWTQDGQPGNSTSSAGDDEMSWVVLLDNHKVYEFKSGDTVIATLDFSKATLA